VTSPQLPLYAVRRSDRARRARLTLTDDGQPLVVLPRRAPDDLAGWLVARHLEWLTRHQRRIVLERRAMSARQPLGDGGSLPLRGFDHLVVVEQSSARRASVERLDGPTPRLVVRRHPADERSVEAVLERWLRAEAGRELELATARRGAEMGLQPSAIAIRDQRTRWGSASARGTLSFSWRLLLAPSDVLDYVVVHELAHLRWRGHGARFWGLVRRHVPDADEHRRWLRQNHRALRAALAVDAG
jgi:predicted metal-dependent hydrolase